MKILIVDDNANNRMVLNLLLQEYGENKNEIYEIEECENGLIAVNKAKRNSYQMIFMDIMMPEMDGIEATKKIRSNNKEVMIIAISALDDEIKQKEILRNGAEDYVSKPIDSKVLNARLDNYFSLLKLRQNDNLSEHRKASNLYTKTIFKRQTIFYVNNEESLAEFWEYYLLRDVGHKIDGLSDVVRAIFSMGEAILSLGGEPLIIVEGTNEDTFFTINRIDVVGDMVLNLIMKKNKEVKEFKANDEKLSFKLRNISSTSVTTSEPKAEKDITTKAQKEEEVDIQKVEISKVNVEDYQTFNYMDPDDLAETEEQLTELSSLMLIAGGTDIEASEVIQIAQSLERIGKNMSPYTESYEIGQALVYLGKNINTNAERFQEIAQNLSSISSAFVSDLQTWLKMTFYEGAPSVDFMDATIITNTQTICAMLTNESETSSEDIDDIFDF